MNNYKCTDCNRYFHIDRGTYDEEWGFHCVYCGGIEEEINVVRLTPRGWVALVIIPTLLVVWGMWQVSANLWYVGDSGSFLGYCWGTMVECFKEAE